MPIRVACGCGQQFEANDALGGKQLACPACGGSLAVPARPAASAVEVQCQCGASYSAPSELIGKQLSCPQCHAAILVQAPWATTAGRQPWAETPHTPPAQTGFVNRECPFCHQQVSVTEYAAHVAQHTALLPDGQMTEHITLAAHLRSEVDLDTVPQVYSHQQCGGSTGMPEEIIRTYLVDPKFYSNYTFCTGCGDYVPMNECFWEETGERLDHYNRRLFRAKPAAYKAIYWLTSAGSLSLCGGLIGVLTGLIFGSPTAMLVCIGVGVGVGFLSGLVVRRFLRLAVLKSGLI